MVTLTSINQKHTLKDCSCAYCQITKFSGSHCIIRIYVFICADLNGILNEILDSSYPGLASQLVSLNCINRQSDLNAIREFRKRKPMLYIFSVKKKTRYQSNPTMNTIDTHCLKNWLFRTSISSITLLTKLGPWRGMGFSKEMFDLSLSTIETRHHEQYLFQVFFIQHLFFGPGRYQGQGQG